MKKPIINVDELTADNVDHLPEDNPIELSSFSNEKLCDIIIANRYLGLYQELSVNSMKELSLRRVSGDTFEYEKYIDENFKTLPKLDFNMPAFGKIIDQIKGMAK